MRRPAALLLALALLVAIAGAASAGRVSGSVVDGTTLEPIVGARVTPIGINVAAAVTNRRGEYRFDDLPAGRLRLRVEADGYEAAVEILTVVAAGTRDVLFALLRPGAADEVVAVSGRAPTVVDTQGEQELRREELIRLPGTRGDALQSIKSLPGVANADAAMGPGLIVIRGAAPEDSKITIDGIEVPLVYHFFGLQSVLPSEFIESIDFVPGGFDAGEGRSTGGVIDIVTRSAQAEEVEGFVETSFINFAGLVQGPISKSQNLHFALGVRRSLIDLVLPAVIPDDANLAFTTAPQYYDGQLRVDWRPDERNHLSSLSLLSYDLLSLLNDNINPNEPLLTGKFENEVTFGRIINSWRHTTDELKNRLTISLGAGRFRAEIGSQRFLKSTGKRVELREDATWLLSRRFALRAGAEGRLWTSDVDVKLPLPPAEGSGMASNFSTAPVVERKDTIRNHLAGAYLITDVKPTDKTRISSGVRFDYFDRISAYTVHPRVAIRHEITPRWAVHGTVGSYSRNFQQAEAISTRVDPELATQYVIGTEHRFARGIRATGSAFYTDRRSLLVQDPRAESPDEAYVNRGFGRSFGAEVLVRARRDNFFGWLAYTLSRSDRVDEPLGNRRLFDFDQTHVVTAVGSYKLGSWTFGGRWVYSTGTPITPIEGAIYDADFNVHLPVLGQVNSDRLDAAHQLDLRIDRKWRFESWSLDAYLDVTNVYAHPRTLGFEYSFDFSERAAIEDLPIVPAFGLRGSF